MYKALWRHFDIRSHCLLVTFDKRLKTVSLIRYRGTDAWWIIKWYVQEWAFRFIHYIQHMEHLNTVHQPIKSKYCHIYTIEVLEVPFWTVSIILDLGLILYNLMLPSQFTSEYHWTSLSFCHLFSPKQLSHSTNATEALNSFCHVISVSLSSSSN